MGTKTLNYNLNNRLIQVVEGMVLADYVYNGFGQRIKKITNESTAVYHYDRFGNLIGESDQLGNFGRKYVYLYDMRLNYIAPNEEIFYYVNDHLGTPQKIFNSSNTVVWAADYRPFGETNITVNTVTNNHRLPGQYFDQETGNHYNYFRHYGPGIGRYLRPDPNGLTGGINLYAFVQNNPVNEIDPFGLFVLGTYNQATGELNLYDLDSGERLTAQFFSGGPAGKAVPNGIYDILGHGGRQDFYRLEPFDVPYGDDIDQRTGRKEFRLHKPGGSTGCVTAKNWDEWRRTKSFIDQTKIFNAEVPSKWVNPLKRWKYPIDTLPWYGRIIVSGSK